MFKKVAIILAVILSIVACESKKVECDFPKVDYVQLIDGEFVNNNKPYMPMVLNYMVNLQTDGENIWASSSNDYQPGNKFKFTTKDSCLAQLQKELNLIKNMGFNAVRVVRIGEQKINPKSKSLSIQAVKENKDWIEYDFDTPGFYEKYLKAIDELQAIINEAGLKNILLLKLHADYQDLTQKHVSKIISHLRNDTAILAFDYFNEPLYFDSLKRTKSEVYEITKEWQKFSHEYAPNHLMTIGLAGVREVFEWDPNMVNADFLSFHPYEKFQKTRVANEIYWFGKVVKKPWIIGETSIPSDGDSVSFDQQLKFAQNALKTTFSCGGKGFSWWQFKDVNWYEFHSDYMGLISKTSDTGEYVMKPTVDAFQNFELSKYPSDSCICLDNYYNLSNEHDFAIVGRLLEENGKPIENGVVMAWSQWWDNLRHSQTKADGSFEINASFDFHHWIITASEYEVTRADVDFTKLDTINGEPTYNLGDIRLKKVK